MSKEQIQKIVKYTPEISFGNVLTLISMIAALWMMYTRAEVRNERQDNRLMNLEQVAREHAAMQTQMMQTQQTLAISLARQQALLERTN